MRKQIEKWVMKHVIKKYNYLYKSHDITSKWIARSTQQN